MAATVIIPCRNEEKTIGDIVATFMLHPETTENVWVCLDADTTDNTAEQVWAHNGYVINTPVRGKGQVVRDCLSIIGRYVYVSQRVILCDGDYTGLTAHHIDEILKPKDGMTIGVPDWPEIEVPERVINAWPRISGFRCLPIDLIPADAHGYLLETQLNLLAIKRHLPIRARIMEGLKAPFQWPLAPKRQAELERDRDWGLRNGWF